MRAGRIALIGVACLTGFAAPSAAVIGTIDNVPAATLLLPYFEVDLDHADGATTLFSVNNASAGAVLAHVVVWSDLSVPVLDFNLYLTGYDVQTINLRDLLIRGMLPRTASDGQDPQDTISPQGSSSQDINFASCSGQLPPPALPASFLSHLQSALTGQASAVLGNRCAGRDLGDRIARGYVTVDTVNNCTLRFPGDTGYFAAGGTGDATDQNVLWGDYFYIDAAAGSAAGETLVHIEADSVNPETSAVGGYTFYGRYVGWTAIDHREALADEFALRYLNGGVFDGGTELIVWRDSKVLQGAFACPAAAGLRPAWFPLGQQGLVIFDEEENMVGTGSFPFSPVPPVDLITPFPAETQRVVVDSSALPLPFDFGWLSLDLDTMVAAAGNNPPEDPTAMAAQAWVTVLVTGSGSDKARGALKGGYDGVQTKCACKEKARVATPPGS
jgi:hypothetical protein